MVINLPSYVQPTSLLRKKKQVSSKSKHRFYRCPLTVKHYIVLSISVMVGYFKCFQFLKNAQIKELLTKK